MLKHLTKLFIVALMLVSWQLSAQHPSDYNVGRNAYPRINADNSVTFRIHFHGSEFINLELFGISRTSYLLIKHGAAVIKFDRKCCKKHKRRSQYDKYQRENNINCTLDHSLFDGERILSGKKDGGIKYVKFLSTRQYYVSDLGEKIESDGIAVAILYYLFSLINGDITDHNRITLT